MDFTSFRRSEELSDIDIILQPEGRRYSLHKFPLYTKSEYIHKLILKDASLRVITLENFPGSAKTFETVADFCYSHFADITKENVVNLTCAAKRLDMQGHANLIDTTNRYLADLLTSAKLTRSIGTIVNLLVQCKNSSANENDDIRSSIVDSCVKSIVEILSKPPTKFPLNKETGASVTELALGIAKEIIHEGVKADVRTEVLMNFIKDYTEGFMEEEHVLPDKVTEKVDELKLDLPVSEDEDDDAEVAQINGKNRKVGYGESSAESDTEDMEDKDAEKTEPGTSDPTENGDEADDSMNKEYTDNSHMETIGEESKENTSSQQEYTDDTGSQKAQDKIDRKKVNKEEKEAKFAEQLDALIMELPDKPRTQRDDKTLQWIIQALEVANRKHCECRQRLLYATSTVLAQVPEQALRAMSPELVCDLLQEAGRSGYHFANTVSVITDFYILDKVKAGQMTKDNFIKLANALPDGFRTNLDTLYEAYSIISQDCTEEEKENYLKALDLSKLSEDTLEKAYEKKSIPTFLIIPALISRCRRLRGELEKAKEIIKLKETEQYRSAIGSSKSQTFSYKPSYTVRERSPTTKTTLSWPYSARVDTRYELPLRSALSGTSSLPASPRHKPLVSTKPLPSIAPLSARYHGEAPKRILPIKSAPVRSSMNLVGSTRTGPVIITPRTSNSVPSTPRKTQNIARTTQRKVLTPSETHVALRGRALPDYSSSGIGPEDARQVMYNLALTSPRLSYMYTNQYDVPERDYSHLKY